MTDSDDELIARLSHAARADAPPPHDPYMDLPLAHEIDVEGNGSLVGRQPVCGARARRELDIRGLQAVTPTEEVRCELGTGHTGAHRACFSRSRWTHHWHAVEWAAAAPRTDAPAPG